MSTLGSSFSLTTNTGRLFTEAGAAGRPSLVFFGFTHCPDIYPTTLYEVTDLFAKLGPDADRLRALFVSGARARYV